MCAWESLTARLSKVYRYKKKSTDIGLNPHDSILGSPTLRGSYDFGKSIDIGKLTESVLYPNVCFFVNGTRYAGTASSIESLAVQWIFADSQ